MYVCTYIYLPLHTPTHTIHTSQYVSIHLIYCFHSLSRTTYSGKDIVYLPADASKHLPMLARCFSAVVFFLFSSFPFGLDLDVLIDALILVARLHFFFSLSPFRCHAHLAQLTRLLVLFCRSLLTTSRTARGKALLTTKFKFEHIRRSRDRLC